MRYPVVCALLLSLVVSAGAARAESIPADRVDADRVDADRVDSERSEPRVVTVVLDPGETQDPVALSEMRREAGRLIGPSGLRLEWRDLQNIAHDESFDDVVVVRLRGVCRMDAPAPYLLDERGPLAYTHTSDGTILSFGEVSCDRLRLSLQRYFKTNNGEKAHTLFGRAMGRVVAHELYHILGQTHDHGKAGVAKACLSAYELVQDRLDLDVRDLHRIRSARGLANAAESR